MKINWKKLIISLAVPLAVGGLSAWLSGGAMERFDSLQKPALAPPSWLFPVVWTILFLMMGVNFAWTLIFFNAGAYLFAFIWLIVLWLLIIVTIYLFSNISFVSALLLVPYALWVAFAGYLNFMIYRLN